MMLGGSASHVTFVSVAPPPGVKFTIRGTSLYFTILTVTLMVSISLLPVSEGLSTPWPVVMAGVAIATLPLIAAFVALQRYDIADIMAGANKG